MANGPYLLHALWGQGKSATIHRGLEAGFLSWTLALSEASFKAGERYTTTQRLLHHGEEV